VTLRCGSEARSGRVRADERKAGLARTREKIDQVADHPLTTAGIHAVARPAAAIDRSGERCGDAIDGGPVDECRVQGAVGTQLDERRASSKPQRTALPSRSTVSRLPSFERSGSNTSATHAPQSKLSILWKLSDDGNGVQPTSGQKPVHCLFKSRTGRAQWLARRPEIISLISSGEASG